MGSKRASGNEGGGEPKRRRQQHYRDNVHNSTNATYGQRAVFGNDEIITTVPNNDSDLDCEDDTEALAYLRTVRTQASAIPHVIVASKAGPLLPPQTLPLPADGLDDQDERDAEEPVDRSIYLDGTGDFRGYYQDGAYVAYPPGYFDEGEYEDEEKEEDYDYEGDNQGYDEGEQGIKEEDIEIDFDDESSFESSEGGPRNSNVDEIRTAYFTSLINQFLALRTVLQANPPAHLVSSLPKSNPTEVDEFGPRSDTFNKWAGRLRGTDPLPAQIASMRKDGVMRLLRILLGGKFLRKNCELRERTSRWIWALLARLPERGELDYQEIGWIRELGKRAVLLMVSLVEMELLRDHFDVGDGSSVGSGSVDGAEVDVDESIDDEEELGPEECYSYDEVALDTTSHPEPATNKDGEKADLAEAATNGTEVKEEDSDVEMQIDSEEEEEDGEVSEAPQQPREPTADIETAKARLLSQLDDASEATGADADIATTEEPAATALEEEAFAALAADEEAQRKEQLQRSRANERATLNMILTVAGELYGQRDLLEFRDPFGGMQAE
ncbi:hypothetical protein F4818DRAFT_402902 [Hypoxylon cercidicola]|nr:hypothetical protein F4818DRAFT_402902 [Hypoxylon cercidicola]